MEIFRCPSCQQTLWEPVTLACGHTFCKKCLKVANRCQICKQRLKFRGGQELRGNTLLSSLLDKCLDMETKVKRITRDLEDLISVQQYEEAVKVACKGVAMAPEHVPLRTLRSQVYLCLKQFPESLREAEVICELQPQNPEAYYRKGIALLLMEKKEEALNEFQRCLGLNPHFTTAHLGTGQILKDLSCSLPSSLEDFVDEVFSRSRRSTVDTSALIAPLEAANIRSQDCGTINKINEDKTISPLVQPSDGTSIALNQEQRKRKEMDDATPPDKERLHSQENEEHHKDCLPPIPLLKDVLSLSDVECSLCIRMFFEPVTTPCGHTFCRECLERCMDHQPYCPLCKQCLREYLRVGSYPITAVLQDVMMTAFPSEMADRKQVHLTEIAEMSNLVSNVPIFVCTMAFPGVPCPLHVFEPRYRLMMRRCLETGTKSFGMCLYESGKSFSDYGCMLEIQHLDFLPDGRSLVETVGRRRFRVLQRGLLDGYHKAEIEYLVDKKLEGEELQELQRLHDMVYQQLEECFSHHMGSLPRRIFTRYASPPPKEDDIQASPDGPNWCWWLLSALPLDPTYQMLILSMTSLKERLFHLKHILSVFLQNRS
ncbi:LON peptidase N-terminal domain and RING finger protein 1-like isoform X2 [Bufo gargarizans]|uniref:LON peptidase N-terminal domain and RING finger protein 1-like isoform X2 n=1 Tax=Bufo gargarizans TaxID=30331 RepID=UPI001CF58B63|nr:LON peptidase N-terminal domain and RING finger protein 1-like isoform X2 [Bufo gargarizans]